MKNDLKKTEHRYALWITLRDGTSYLAGNLYNTPDEAMRLFSSMPEYSRANGDEENAKDWESARADVVEVVIAVPAAMKAVRDE